MNILKFLHYRRSRRERVEPDPVLIIRDYLAVDRTRLANERSLLAYVSTGFTSIVAGITGIRLFQDIFMRSLSVAVVVMGLGVILIGLVRFNRMHKRLSRLGVPDYDDVLKQLRGKPGESDQSLVEILGPPGSEVQNIIDT